MRGAGEKARQKKKSKNYDIKPGLQGVGFKVLGIGAKPTKKPKP